MAVGAQAQKGGDTFVTFYPAILWAFTGIWRGNAGKKKGLAESRKPLILLGNTHERTRTFTMLLTRT